MALVIQQLDLICHFEPVTLFSKQRGYFAKPEDVLNLACAQIAALETQLGEIGQIIDRLKIRVDRKWQLALAQMFSDLSRAVFEAWKRVQARASHEARAFSVSATRADQRTSSTAMRKQKRRKAG
jgi:hypothetical protein